MEEESTAIIVFAHGSVVSEANQQVALLAEQVARLSKCKTSCAFLEIAQPDLPAAIRLAVEAGARRIVVIPHFLSMGVHVRRDLPRLIEEQKSVFPGIEILVGQSLEAYSGMAELILNRVREVLPEGSKI